MCIREDIFSITRHPMKTSSGTGFQTLGIWMLRRMNPPATHSHELQLTIAF